MATYATAADLASYVQDNPEVQAPLATPPSGFYSALSATLTAPSAPTWSIPHRPQARPCGPHGDPAGGAQPGDLRGGGVPVAARRGGVRRDDDYLPAELRVVTQAGRTSPKMLEELAGSGLVTYSGTLATTVAI
jgi:hypothetical protein